MKILLILLVLVCATSFILVYADSSFCFDCSNSESLFIKGSNGDDSISIRIQNHTNIIIFETFNGDDYFVFNSDLKYYNSGGFSLKNPELKLFLWAHPFSESEYRIFILTDNNLYRITGDDVLRILNTHT